MTDEIKTQEASRADTVKLAGAGLIVAAGVAGYYLVTGGTWLRWLCVVVSLVLAAAVIAWSGYGATLKQFVLDARVELRKIVWTTRHDTLVTTGIVFLFVTFAGFFFWLLDLGLAALTKYLTGQGG